MIEVNLTRRSGERFFERDLQVVPKIGAARRPASLRLLLRTDAVTEKHIEDITETGVAEAASKTEIRKACAAACTVAYRAEAIVLGTFIRIRKHLIGFIDFLEAMLGLRFVVRDVGVMLTRKRTVRSLNIIGAGASAYAEHFIKIFCRHAVVLLDFYVRKTL
jgi:hypothetical protein